MINSRGLFVLVVLALCFVGVRASAADNHMLDVKALCAAARAIYEDAGRNEAAAVRLAAARGHDAYTIAMGKEIMQAVRQSPVPKSAVGLVRRVGAAEAD